MIDPNEWMVVVSLAVVRREDHYQPAEPIRLRGMAGQVMTVAAHTINSAGPNRLNAPVSPGQIEEQSHALLDRLMGAAEELDFDRTGRDRVGAVAVRGSMLIGAEPQSLREVWAD